MVMYMSGLLLCGKRATSPYVIREAGVNIYTIEELCYYLYNNTYMVEQEFFNNELVEFVKTEFNMPSLAQKLKYGVDHKSDLATMVLDVLSSNGYYTEDERKNIEKTLMALGSKSKAERMKARADMLLERKKYLSAGNAYKEILNCKEEKYEPEFIANIWNNIGVTYVRQFMYEDAVKCFKTACDIKRCEEYFDNMVCAAIFSAKEEIITDTAAQYQITDELMNNYLRAIESNKKMIVKEKSFADMKERLVYDGSKELAEYKLDVQKIFELWKNEYRQENR